MYEAAVSILRDRGKPMVVSDIYTEIVKNGLFKFGAKDPIAMLSSTLRKKSDVVTNKGKVIFVKKGTKEYGLAEWE